MSLKKQPKKQLTKQQKSDRDDYFSTFIALGIVLLIPFIFFVSGLVVDMINNAEYKKIMEKGDHIDIEQDNVVITYPAGLFVDDDARDDSVETLKNSEGMKKVVKNSDGTITALMSVERYEKIKEASMYTAQSLPYMIINENTAVRDLTYNSEMTLFDIVVDKEVETLEKECSDILAMVSLYHVCNMNSDAEITINYIDAYTEEVYKTQVYDLDSSLKFE